MAQHVSISCRHGSDKMTGQNRTKIQCIPCMCSTGTKKNNKLHKQGRIRPLLLSIHKRSIKSWSHIKKSNPACYHYKALASQELNLKRSPLSQTLSSYTIIQKIRPNQIITKEKEKTSLFGMILHAGTKEKQTVYCGRLPNHSN